MASVGCHTSSYKWIVGRIGGWLGRFGGTALGALLAGWSGALIGFVLGALTDRQMRLAPYRARRWRRITDGAEAGTFHAVLFGWLGHLAKIDGRVSEAEVDAARGVMFELGLNERGRALAVELFNRGKQARFPRRRLARRLAQRAPGRDWAPRAIGYAARVVVADRGRADPAAERRLLEFAHLIGVETAEVKRRLRGACGPFVAGHLQPTLNNAYSLLGVDRAAGEADIRRAYRRMISRHHPDRMVARNLPEKDVRAAGERTHEIRAAFDRIRRSRGF